MYQTFPRSGAPPAGAAYKRHYRPDIDGLRAIAVTSVVLYHAGVSRLASGFVGVDIFFAISGYLIGGIIFGEVSAGRFSFAEFYARRARRILPALFVVVIFTCLAGLMLLSAAELRAAAMQSVAALAGASNLHFWSDAGYFAESSDLKPLLMTWSLGVEEQFYVFFPFFIILVSKIRYRLRLAALAAMCAISFALSIYLTQRASTGAFYLLPPRAWEMGAGALLAMLHRMRPGLVRSAWARNDAIAASALIVLLASLTLLKGFAFPGWAALPPVIATVALLNSADSRVNKVMLGNRAMTFVGLVSYSWYLWHWPLMAFARIVSDTEPPLGVMLPLAGVSFLFAVASQKWIEQPFRQSRLSAPLTLRNYMAALLAVLAIPLAIFFEGGLPQRLSMSALQGEAVAKEGRSTECLANFKAEAPPASATCSPAKPAIALLGDSHAAAISPGLLRAARLQGLTVRQFTKSACSPMIGYTNKHASHSDHMHACATFVPAAVHEIVTDPTIRVVYVAGNYGSLDVPRYRPVGDTGRLVPSSIAWADGLGRTIDLLHRGGKRVVVIGDVPRFKFDPFRHFITEEIPARQWLASKLGTFVTTSAGRGRREDLVPGYAEASQFVGIIARRHGAEWFDPALQLCSQDTCAIKAGDTPLYFDKHHLSSAGARTISWPEDLT